MSPVIHFDAPKLTSSTSDLHSFVQLSNNNATVIAKVDMLQGHAVALHVKNSRDVRVTQGGEECVERVQHDSSGTTSFFTRAFSLFHLC